MVCVEDATRTRIVRVERLFCAEAMRKCMKIVELEREIFYRAFETKRWASATGKRMTV